MLGRPRLAPRAFCLWRLATAAHLDIPRPLDTLKQENRFLRFCSIYGKIPLLLLHSEIPPVFFKMNRCKAKIANDRIDLKEMIP